MSVDEGKKSVRFSSVAQIDEIYHEAECDWDSAIFQARIGAFNETNNVSVGSRCDIPVETLKGDRNKRHVCSRDDSGETNIQNLFHDRKRQRRRAISSVLIAQETARHHAESQPELDVERFIAFFAAKESRRAKAFAALIAREVETAVLGHEEHSSHQQKKRNSV
ncbi:hypothetical protein MHU86_20842 [Fragilaria crotonensis]|nr:hypothetical protein MHU86_20842 [Fragilaria crotonensis]